MFDFLDWKERGPLRRWRRRERLSQAAVGALLCKTTQAVRDYEAGAYLPDKDTRDRLAAILGTRPDLLERRWRRWMDQRREAPCQ